MTKFCPKCGEKLTDEAKFCKNCGASLENRQTNTQNFQQSNQYYQVPKVENEHKVATIIGYICAVLIPLFGFIFGIYLVTRNDSDKANRHGKIIIGVSVIIWIISFLLMR